LIGDMFEGVSDLDYLSDALEAADFVLSLALEKVPSEVGLVSLFDIDKGEFVVVRQTGGSRNALLLRLKGDSALAQRAMGAGDGEAVVVTDFKAQPELRDGRWRKIGTRPRSLVCAAVQVDGRHLGLIELANPHDGNAFGEDDGHALAYIGQRYAAFVDKHGVILDPDVILAEPEADADADV
jgi:GAF domain-containing protein